MCKAKSRALTHVDTIVISKQPGGFIVTPQGGIHMAITWEFFFQGQSLGTWAMDMGTGVLGDQVF